MEKEQSEGLVIHGIRGRGEEEAEEEVEAAAAAMKM